MYHQYMEGYNLVASTQVPLLSCVISLPNSKLTVCYIGLACHYIVVNGAHVGGVCT